MKKKDQVLSMVAQRLRQPGSEALVNDTMFFTFSMTTDSRINLRDVIPGCRVNLLASVKYMS